MQAQSTFRTLCSIAVLAVMAFGNLLLVGCTPEASVGVSVGVNTQTGATTVTGTVTVTFKHQPLQQLAMWQSSTLTGTELASLDPSQAILNLSLSNAAISSSSGQVTVTVTDDTTGAVVGTQTFQYVVNGNGLFAQDPSAVSSWLSGFTSYSSLDVTVAANTSLQATSSGTASVTANAVYQGTTYASGTASWAGISTGGGGCHTKICPEQ
jgi:hypothetical protein